jgi:hypothetical protein
MSDVRELSDDAAMQQAIAWVDYSGKEGASLTFDEWAATKGLLAADKRAVAGCATWVLMRGRVGDAA